MANNRIYYAQQQVGLKGITTGGAYTAARGVQSVGTNTTFELVQAYQLGEQEIYANQEGIPAIEITLSKLLDGNPLLFHLASLDAVNPTLAGRSVCKSQFAMSIFDESLDYCTGAPLTIMGCSGVYVSSVGYNFPSDGNFSEDMTLVGNDKVWKGDARIVNVADAARAAGLSFNGVFTGSATVPGLGGINRRENFIFTTGLGSPDYCLLPTEIPGISAGGLNVQLADGTYRAHVSNISVSTDMGREDIMELGRRTPYARTVSYPIQVTTEIGVTSTSGDWISATENGILTTGTQCYDLGNLSNQTIRVATCEGTRIYLGTKNKLSAVTYGGGDAGGGNVITNYTYQTFNKFTVMHSGDPNVSGVVWWAGRNTYLTG